jgi:hypothetical protein
MKKPLMGMKTFCSEGDFLVFFSSNIADFLCTLYIRLSLLPEFLLSPSNKHSPFLHLYGGHIRFALDVHTSSYSS